MSVFDRETPQEDLRLLEEIPRSNSLQKWIGLLRKHRETRSSGVLTSWLRRLEPLKARPNSYILQAVNARVGELNYIEDHVSTGLRDAWLPAATTLLWGGGDCEDLQFLKMVGLIYLGFRSTSLVLVTQEFGPYHAVCTTRYDGTDGLWLLDNQFTRVHLAERAAEFMGYKPRRGFSMTHWWKY